MGGQVGDDEYQQAVPKTNTDNQSSDTIIATSNGNNIDMFEYIIGICCACFVICGCFVLIFCRKRNKKQAQQMQTDMIMKTGQQQSTYHSGESNVGSVESVLSLSPKSVAESEHTQEMNHGLMFQLGQMQKIKENANDDEIVLATHAPIGIVDDIMAQLDDENANGRSCIDIIDEDLNENDVVLLGDFGVNIAPPTQPTSGCDIDIDLSSSSSDCNLDVGNAHTVNGFENKNSLNVPMMHSLDASAVDTQRYIAHGNEDDDLTEEEFGDDIRTKGFIKGSIGKEQGDEENILKNVEINGNDYVTKQ